ncbi:hypothetical protein K505DRAFT_87580 [Melanomma pulvis-pyrius CBS 109.77]|uniref:Uncharacterized protein n=1 Tax=Melanomma pulvis-pyrius CBS 109.77 TaxID=1314802 RepID=A0A6A6XRR2_9PLEO|nr:hypothetical protein K505DRAFT_87580 [Melanomma pulvis-pyrius CBS 109.77]
MQDKVRGSQARSSNDWTTPEPSFPLPASRPHNLLLKISHHLVSPLSSPSRLPFNNAQERLTASTFKKEMVAHAVAVPTVLTANFQRSLNVASCSSLETNPTRRMLAGLRQIAISAWTTWDIWFHPPSTCYCWHHSTPLEPSYPISSDASSVVSLIL